MDTAAYNSLFGALSLGLILGLRHAMDADHVAAVATLVSRHRSVTRSALLGACWGAGHTLALLGAGVAVIMFKFTISAGTEKWLEMAVALVLVVLGGRVLLQSVGALTLHTHPHSHGGHSHSHGHLHVGTEESDHLHLVRLGKRPFLIGLLHGLAGSAALMLLVLATLPSALAGLLYILVFGVGSTVGMVLLSGVIGLPFKATGRSPRLQAATQAVAGAACLLLGATLAWRGFGA